MYLLVSTYIYYIDLHIFIDGVVAVQKYQDRVHPKYETLSCGSWSEFNLMDKKALPHISNLVDKSRKRRYYSNGVAVLFVWTQTHKKPLMLPLDILSLPVYFFHLLSKICICLISVTVVFASGALNHITVLQCLIRRVGGLYPFSPFLSFPQFTVLIFVQNSYIQMLFFYLNN